MPWRLTHCRQGRRQVGPEDGLSSFAQLLTAEHVLMDNLCASVGWECEAIWTATVTCELQNLHCDRSSLTRLL